MQVIYFLNEVLNMKVIKFGGSSLANGDAFAQAIAIIKRMPTVKSSLHRRPASALPTTLKSRIY